MKIQARYLYVKFEDISPTRDLKVLFYRYDFRKWLTDLFYDEADNINQIIVWTDELKGMIGEIKNHIKTRGVSKIKDDDIKYLQELYTLLYEGNIQCIFVKC